MSLYYVVTEGSLKGDCIRKVEEVVTREVATREVATREVATRKVATREVVTLGTGSSASKGASKDAPGAYTSVLRRLTIVL